MRYARAVFCDTGFERVRSVDPPRYLTLYHTRHWVIVERPAKMKPAGGPGTPLKDALRMPHLRASSFLISSHSVPLAAAPPRPNTTMKNTQYAPSQIITKSGPVEAAPAQGQTHADADRSHVPDVNGESRFIAPGAAHLWIRHTEAPRMTSIGHGTGPSAPVASVFCCRAAYLNWPCTVSTLCGPLPRRGLPDTYTGISNSNSATLFGAVNIAL